MKKIKIADAPNRAIDWLVAKAEGAASSKEPDEDFWLQFPDGTFRWLREKNYTADPAQAWPIIEREDINLRSHMGTDKEKVAFMWRDHMPAFRMRGADFLQAAMRCYCASVFGEEAEVPEELLS